MRLLRLLWSLRWCYQLLGFGLVPQLLSLRSFWELSETVQHRPTGLSYCRIHSEGLSGLNEKWWLDQRALKRYRARRSFDVVSQHITKAPKRKIGHKINHTIFLNSGSSRLKQRKLFAEKLWWYGCTSLHCLLEKHVTPDKASDFYLNTCATAKVAAKILPCRCGGARG